MPPMELPFVIDVIEQVLLKVCKRNQYPKKIKAGIGRIVIKKNMGINVSTLA